MNNNEIQVTGFENTSISIVPEIQQHRDKILIEAHEIKSVDNDFDQEVAMAVFTQLKTLSKRVENTRCRVKAPILQLGRKVDQIAKEFCHDLDAQADRIGKVIAAYQEKVRLEAEVKKQKLEQERQATIDKARAELAEKEIEVQGALDEDTRQKAQMEAQQIIENTNLAVVQSKQLEANLSPIRPAGMTFKQPWKFELIDVNALFKARPDLCNIEPNGTAIRLAIKAGLRDCPGLKIFQENQVTARIAV